MSLFDLLIGGYHALHVNIVLRVYSSLPCASRETCVCTISKYMPCVVLNMHSGTRRRRLGPGFWGDKKFRGFV